MRSSVVADGHGRRSKGSPRRSLVTRLLRSSRSSYATFGFPMTRSPAARGRHGLRGPPSGGLLLFDTGFGFGNDELDARYHPKQVRRIEDALRRSASDSPRSTPSPTATSTPTTPVRTRAFPGVPIYVQPPSGRSPTRRSTRSSNGSTSRASRYEQIHGDHESCPTTSASLATPGHTPGHQSLAVRTAEGWSSSPARPATRPRSGRATRPRSRAARVRRTSDAYDRSIQRLRDLRSAGVRFGHDRRAWTA